ncbi:TonB-dependent receptor [uncultured Flavobacterium sp.]|uniref:TonB-dependent receptor n=1 Tax=uncultured Flavobacterium sp. TaxID=165435 RepID=UPI0025D96903|nr:TonB-dependent receptor [uncultured Flavobacterium sp.]
MEQILDTITAQHNVKFNYTKEDVFGHNIFPPEKAMPLKAKLVYITNRTALNHKENGEYIIIYSSKEKSPKKFCAYITDEFGTIIGNASVQLSESKNIVAGSDGYFELNTQLPKNIYVSHLGYKPVSIETSKYNGDCLKIQLPIDIIELDELITERYLTSGIFKKKDGSFTITPEKFGILPGLIEPDVLLAMQQLPGITSIDETVSNINVRGGTHDQNLFMWNGIRLFQTGHFFGLISAINPAIAYDIKIAKNGTSAFYGESVSSVIDISSRSSAIEDGSTNIGTNMINLDFHTKLKLSEKSNIELSARRSFTDILDFPTYTKYSQRIFQNTVVTEINNSTDVNYKSDKEFYFYDFTGEYHQKIGDRHDFYLHAIGIDNTLDFTQGSSSQTDVITSISSLDQKTLGTSAGWRTQWNSSHQSELGIYASYYDVNGTDQSLELNEKTQQENMIQNYGLRFSNTNIVSNMFKLHSGYQFDQLKIKNTDITNGTMPNRDTNQTLRTHAIIGEMEYDPINSKVYVRTGLRFNYVDQLKSIYIEPRLLLNYKINNIWKIEFLAERKSQTTSQVVELQDDFLGLENRRWVLANDIDVPVQYSSQISAGVTYTRNGWLLSLDNFYKKVNDITTYSQAFQDQLEQIQAKGSYSVYGTEFLIQKQYKNFYAWLSYTWNNNNYKFDGIEPRKFPSNFEISHNINTAAIYEIHNFKIALGSKWFTGHPITNPLLTIPVYDDNGNPSILYDYPNSDNLVDFFQVNLSASYRWNVKPKIHVDFGLSVLNIFNKQNIINRHYRINSNEDIEVVNTFSVARTPNAMIKISF